MNGKGFAVKTLAEVPSVPQDEPGDPDWRPLQHHFRINAFGLNVFTAPAEGTVLLAPHDERQSGQQELYLVLEGEVEFEVGGETFLAGRATAVAVPEPAVKRRAVARTAGASLLVVGSRPGCFETTWRASHFADVPRAGRATTELHK
jgi:hypothetical protein